MINTSLQLRSFHISAVIVAIVVVLSRTAVAQIDNPGGSQSMFRGVSGVTLGATMQQWTLQDSGTVLQQSAPVSVAIPIGNRMLIAVMNSGAVSRSTVDTGNGEAVTEVTDVVDTRISLSYVLPGDKIWLTGGVSIPTGRTRLNAEQLQLTSLISQTAFAYQVPTFGQGYTGNIGLVYAGTITRRMVLGAGLSYFYKAAYEPLEVDNKFEYDGGDEISANIGYDFITFSKTGRISLDITGTYFLDDQLTNETETKKIFRSGPRVIALAAYSLKSGNYQHYLVARVRYRQPNTVLTDSSETKYDASTQIEAQYSLSTSLTEWLYGTASAEMKTYTADQVSIGGILKETGKASIVGGGVSGSFLFSDVIMPTVSMRYFTGSILLDETDRSVSGVEVGVNLKVSF